VQKIYNQAHFTTFVTLSRAPDMRATPQNMVESTCYKGCYRQIGGAFQ